LTYDIRFDMLGDDDGARVYREYPEFEAGSDTFCPTCRKTGTYTWKGVATPCDCRMQLQLAKHYTAAGVGADYFRLTWEDYVAPPPQTLHLYAANFHNAIAEGTGMLFTGTNGTGKTMLATLTIKQLIKMGFTAYVSSFSDAIDRRTESFGDDVAARFFDRKFLHTQALLLDDLGQELHSSSDLARSTLDKILRSRVKNNRPTLLTTNLSHRELETRYGIAIASLLKHKSIPIDLVDVDFRPQSREAMMKRLISGEVRPIV
jgi:DNA replication protein DnaC